jgi:cytokinesis protein
MVSFTPSKRLKTPTHKLRKSEASGASGRRSPDDSGDGSTPFPTSPASSLRPATGTPLSSESERTSRFSSSETHAIHLSHLFYKPHSTHEEFNFPRPVRDEDIEALFDYVSRTRDLPSVNNLTIEQEWQLGAWSGKLVMAGGEESRRAHSEAG